jgi:RHS repeat-associated protein
VIAFSLRSVKAKLIQHPLHNGMQPPLCTYDSNGNVTNDGTNAYSWNEFSKMKSVNSGATSVYDAFGRTVEIDNGSTHTEIWFTQLGKTVFMNGSAEIYAYWPAPGGGSVLYNGNIYFMHKDWLGSARILSLVSSTSSVLSDRAFAPYGEVYDIFGGTTQRETMFGGGLTQDIVAGMYDTPNRELQGSQQGRWLSPDPSGSRWNQYAYPTNPNSRIDPLGLDDEGGGGGDDGGGDGGDDPGGAGGIIGFGGDPGLGLGDFPGDPLSGIDPNNAVTGPGGQPPAPPPCQADICVTVYAPYPDGCAYDACVTDTYPPDVPTYAFPFYNGMNGAIQYLKYATKGPPGVTPTPPLSPANEPPPTFPEGFQSAETKLAAAALDVLGDILSDIIVTANPCLMSSNPFACEHPNGPRQF